MEKNRNLKYVANENRRRIVEMVYRANVGHVGGALSIIDVLTAIYENDVDFAAKARSKVVLSKGHAVPAIYAALVQKGIIDEEELSTFRQINSRLQGHPYTRSIPEVDATTGLLGQGLSIAIGMAIVKKSENENTRVYAIVGDGEMHEGQIWEAMLFAAHYQMDNLVFIIDYNKLSSSHETNTVINLESLEDKLKAFNFNVVSIDGHNMEEITTTLNQAKENKGKPMAIIANTTKGKGVSFMENNPKWHSSGLTDEEYAIAMSEISELGKVI